MVPHRIGQPAVSLGLLGAVLAVPDGGGGGGDDGGGDGGDDDGGWG
jgi:hypothetical protein